MTKRMLIDATHAEETRVVVLDGNRLEDFDVETSTKRQLKGNIYLAKVVRVEPSLQACFVEYGGNRHGFLAFSEIHPDYYQIPVADRQRLIDQEAEEAEREEAEADRELAQEQAGGHHARAPVEQSQAPALHPEATEAERGEPWTAPDLTWGEPAPPDDTAEMRAERQSPPETPTPEAEAHVPTAEPEARVPTAEPEAHAPTAEPEAHGPPAETEAHAFTAETEARAPTAEPETAPPVLQPEAAAAETGDESGATAQQLAEPPAPAGPTAQTGEPPAAADEAAERQSRRAQPLIIEPETLSGPRETEPLPAESQHESAAAESSEPWGSREAQPASDTEPHEAPAEVAATDTEEENGDLAEDYGETIPEAPPPETVGGESDNADEQRERRPPPRFLRNYKIQEVIRRRQILLVQVVKEERGTKGAALTTYLSLAGRFCVLMPNSPRGGGISRKITSASDRRRLKEIIAELAMPKGMGLIVRTAGANRPKPEIKRDCEYLLRLWDDIREHTLKSVAPALIYEEASLIKRAIRDVYSRDIDEIQVDGEEGWRAAHEFMRMLMPSHAKKVQLWRDPSQPLFTKYQVEAQLDAMLQPTVQLRSGGYLVINQTEALVAIDVNSGRSTRERNVEETALRTNLEAVDEVARQLRLRDLAGLIVIDLIDMEAKKHNAMVERRIKEALKNDRARIQVGHISHFGLLEMSRQRLRPSLAETSFILCPHCGGTGHVRSTENAAIHVLRGIEDEGSKRRSAEIVVLVATPIALYILNHKRDRLREIELRYAMRVTILADDTLVASQFRIDRVRPQIAKEGAPAAITPDMQPPALPAPRFEPEEAEEVVGEEETDLEEPGAEEGGEEDGAEEADGEAARAEGGETEEEKAEQAERRRRRRRRRRGGRREDGAQAAPAAAASSATLPEAEPAQAADQVREEPEIVTAGEDVIGPDLHIEGVPEHAGPASEDDARRRRSRRGGRRRRREPGEGEASPFAAPGAEQPDLPPVYIGPTPANPFGGHAFDIFDVLEQVEANAALRQEPAEPLVRPSLPEREAVAGPSGLESLAAPAEPKAVAALSGQEAPAAPAESEAPAASAESEAKAAPAGWEAQATPAEPEAPTTPAGWEAQATPAGWEAQATPAGWEAQATPAEPEAPTTPAEWEAQAPPAESEAPAVPAESEAPAAPTEREIVNTAAPEPAPAESIGELVVAEPVPSEAGAQPIPLPESAPPEVANDVAPEPAIRPIIIGSGEEAVEKKRGWWRR